MAISTYLSIITLDVNGLNYPIKRHRMAEWIIIIKKDSSICSLYGTHFRSKDTHRLKVKEWRKVFQVNGNGVVAFISSKTNFKTAINDKEEHYVMIKECGSQVWLWSRLMARDRTPDLKCYINVVGHQHLTYVWLSLLFITHVGQNATIVLWHMCRSTCSPQQSWCLPFHSHAGSSCILSAGHLTTKTFPSWSAQCWQGVNPPRR